MGWKYTVMYSTSSALIWDYFGSRLHQHYDWWNSSTQGISYSQKNDNKWRTGSHLPLPISLPLDSTSELSPMGRQTIFKAFVYVEPLSSVRLSIPEKFQIWSGTMLLRWCLNYWKYLWDPASKSSHTAFFSITVHYISVIWTFVINSMKA